MVLGDIDEKQVVEDEVTHRRNVPRENTLEYQFATSTTMHGLSNVADAHRKWVRAFWLLAVLLALSLLIWQIITLSLQYSAYEAVTEFYHDRPNGLTFPAITVCPYNRFKKKAIEEVSKGFHVDPKAMWKYLSYSMGTVQSPSNADKLLVAETHRNLSKALGGEDKINVRELVERVSHHLEDIVPMTDCVWIGAKAGLCRTAMFRPIMTAMGRCWSFNFGEVYDPSLKQELPGPGHGLNMLLFLDPSQHAEQVGSGGNTQHGARLLIHSPEEYPSFETEVVAIAPGVYSYVALEASHDIRAKPPWGKCGERPLSLFKEYSQDNCHTQHIILYLRENCKCVPLQLIESAKDHDRACTPSELYSCSKEIVNYFNKEIYMTADCPVDCDIMRYRARVSHAQNPNIMTSETLDMLIKNQSAEYADIIRSSMLQIEVYFQRLKVNVMKQKPGGSFESLLADIGGQLGLFVGASVITVCEFLEYFIMKCHIMSLFYRTKRDLRRHERNASDTEALPEKNANFKMSSLDDPSVHSKLNPNS